MAVAIARRTSLAGAELQLLVLAGGRRWCTAIDLASGALVTGTWRDAVAVPAPFSVTRARLDDDADGHDPMRPEAVVLASAPEAAGRMPSRRAKRLLRPLLHPPGEHLLGFAGPALPYWMLTGERPSAAVVAPPARPRVTATTCRFWWRGLPHRLPVHPDALATAPARPDHLVVALTAPRQGHCYKVVLALL